MALHSSDNSGLDDLSRPYTSLAGDDQALAARYAPLLRFDAAEPFLPLAAGYTIFRDPEGGPSPSFARQIRLDEPGKPPARLAIEYAIWWDWDIQHLYELEHAWVYLDEAGRVVRAEASWHGGLHEMAVEGRPPLSGNRLILYSEPGKHAFAPTPAWFKERADVTLRACTRRAGCGGLLVTRLFDGLITKTPLADRLAHTYLERQAFQPSWAFSQTYLFPPEALVPWPALFRWIPGQVARWVDELAQTIPPHERRVLRIAHRGASAYAPENSLAAIRQAAALGADMVELDVQLSSDGVPVIIHDLDLSRINGSQASVARQSLAELKQLDLGEGERIPTLAEALEACLAHELGPYLELKSGGAIEPTVKLLREYDLHQDSIITSFRPDWLAQARALEPKLTTSILFGAVALDPVALAQAIGATYVHPAWENQAPAPHTLLTPDWIGRVRAAGLGLICWHEERPAEIAALKGLGVDGICSDAPDLLL
jgi:glycerophosphoryl diester phosphodiesterase